MTKKNAINWDDIRLFLALVRGGSARAASNDLGMSHTTLSRRADQLEKSLGSRLFDRNVDGYQLNSNGETLMESALKMEESINTAQRQLLGLEVEVRGRIRLTTADVLVNYFLMPGLVEFTQNFKEIDLDILLSYDVFDLNKREADVALRFIRVTNQPPENLVGRKLATVTGCYYASKNYLSTHNPWDVDTQARWIGWEDAERYPWWVKSSPFPHIPVYGSFNNVLLQLEAAKQGMGITIFPCFLGDQIPELERIPKCKPFDHSCVWMLSHPDLRETARFRVFRSFLARLFEERQSELQVIE